MHYADHLERIGTPLYRGAGVRWMSYRGALIPASLVPTFVDVDAGTAGRLLAESGAYFLRWSSEPSAKENGWWWMVCRDYSIERVSGNTRHNIRRGYKKCRVERLPIATLAEEAYPSYLKAFERFKNATPEGEEEFRSRLFILSEDESLFHGWGVRVKGRLVGYLICTVEDGCAVSVTEGRFDPDYLSCYPWLALMDTVLTEYVAGEGLPVSNGERAIAHDTNMQEFLLRFGFERHFCRLNVQYQPYLKAAVSCLYPLRSLIPDLKITHNVKATLFQEEIRRGCH
ncbi:hypothetical protein LPW11_15785 [Geomonas sp. RF6]|uniref:hypothetical protein n=1 Tax=Geomonas sp. RF6 TaxID=2897342 RepID=UPI001E62FFA5|nr:hypothetical protein [Geomonas sp. RF6]UFS69349.1 hypothetical protein LPW11_15785 [Geomonas sp. RF6]